eukprot:SAG31_NODE_27602_length_423_cov_0.944444_1_plen_40_part_01
MQFKMALLQHMVFSTYDTNSFHPFIHYRLATRKERHVGGT